METIRGLTPEQRQVSAAEFFEAFPWEQARLDPATLTAEEFLLALDPDDGDE